MTKEEIAKLIIEQWKEGYIVFETIEGLSRCKMEDFVKQPLEGQLYDLNRCMSVVLTFLGEAPWNNEYGMVRLVQYYYDRCKELEERLRKYEQQEA